MRLPYWVAYLRNCVAVVSNHKTGFVRSLSLLKRIGVYVARRLRRLYVGEAIPGFVCFRPIGLTLERRDIYSNGMLNE